MPRRSSGDDVTVTVGVVADESKFKAGMRRVEQELRDFQGKATRASYAPGGAGGNYYRGMTSMVAGNLPRPQGGGFTQTNPLTGPAHVQAMYRVREQMTTGLASVLSGGVGRVTGGSEQIARAMGKKIDDAVQDRVRQHLAGIRAFSGGNGRPGGGGGGFFGNGGGSFDDGEAARRRLQYSAAELRFRTEQQVAQIEEERRQHELRNTWNNAEFMERLANQQRLFEEERVQNQLRDAWNNAELRERLAAQQKLFEEERIQHQLRDTWNNAEFRERLAQQQEQIALDKEAAHRRLVYSAAELRARTEEQVRQIEADKARASQRGALGSTKAPTQELSKWREGINSVDRAYRFLRRTMTLVYAAFLGNILVHTFLRWNEALLQTNARLERVRLGMAQVTLSAGRFFKEGSQTEYLKFGDQLQLSLLNSRYVIGKLLEDSIKFGINFKESIEVFPALVAPALRLNASLQDTVELTRNLVIFGAKLGLSQSQLVRTVDNIFKGQRVQNTELGSALGLTTKQVQAWIKSKTLVEELTTRLAGVNATLGEQAKTYDGIKESITSLIQAIAQEASFVLFEDAKSALESARDALRELRDDPAQMAQLSEYIRAGFGAMYDALKYLIDHRQEIMGSLQAFAEIVLAASGTALVGGLVFGPAGAVIGGIGGAGAAYVNQRMTQLGKETSRAWADRDMPGAMSAHDIRVPSALAAGGVDRLAMSSHGQSTGPRTSEPDIFDTSSRLLAMVANAPKGQSIKYGMKALAELDSMKAVHSSIRTDLANQIVLAVNDKFKFDAFPAPAEDGKGGKDRRETDLLLARDRNIKAAIDLMRAERDLADVRVDEMRKLRLEAAQTVNRAQESYASALQQKAEFYGRPGEFDAAQGRVFALQRQSAVLAASGIADTLGRAQNRYNSLTEIMSTNASRVAPFQEALKNAKLPADKRERYQQQINDILAEQRDYEKEQYQLQGDIITQQAAQQANALEYLALLEQQGLELAKQKEIMFDLGGELSDAVTNSIFGSGSLQENLAQVGKSAGRQYIGAFIEETFKQKIGKLDLGMKKNLLEFIPGLGKPSGEMTGEGFASGFMDSLGTLLGMNNSSSGGGDLSSVGNRSTIEAAGGIIDSFGSAFGGNEQSAVLPNGQEDPAKTGRFGQSPVPVWIVGMSIGASGANAGGGFNLGGLNIPQGGSSGGSGYSTAIDAVNQVKNLYDTYQQISSLTSGAGGSGSGLSGLFGGGEGGSLGGLGSLFGGGGTGAAAAGVETGGFSAGAGASSVAGGTSAFGAAGAGGSGVGGIGAAGAAGGAATGGILLAALAIMQGTLGGIDAARKASKGPMTTPGKVSDAGARGALEGAGSVIPVVGPLASKALGGAVGLVHGDSRGASAGRGAIAGLGIGAILGPMGMAIGAILGAILGSVLYASPTGGTLKSRLLAPYLKDIGLDKSVRFGPAPSSLKVYTNLYGANAPKNLPGSYAPYMKNFQGFGRASEAFLYGQVATAGRKELNNAVVASIMGASADLGLAGEDAFGLGREFTKNVTQSYEKGGIKLLAARRKKRINRTQLQEGLGGLIGAYQDLAQSIDTAALAQAAFTADGKVSLKALQRAAEDANAVITSGIASALQRGVETGNVYDFAQSMADTFAQTFTKRVSEQLATTGSFGEALSKAVAYANQASEALVSGDMDLYNQLIQQARAAFLSGQEQATITAGRIIPQIMGFNSSIGAFGGAKGFINQTGAGLTHYDTDTMKTVSGPMGHPQLAVVHGGEKVYNPRHHDDLVAEIRRLRTSAPTIHLNINLDGKKIAKEVSLMIKDGSSGPRLPQAQVGVL